MPWLQLSTTDLMLWYQKLTQNQKMIEFLTFYWVIKGTQGLMQEAARKCAASQETYAHVYNKGLLQFLKREF